MEIAKSMVDMAALQKSENVSPKLREAARRVDQRLQLIHLGRSNPDAARQWVEQRTPA